MSQPDPTRGATTSVPPVSRPPPAESREAILASLTRELHALDPEEASPRTPPIPDHALVRRIGRGAYGDVWMARNALGTLRAIKIVYRARFKEDRPYEREFNGILKYEPVSRTHEGLVQVLHVGRNDLAGCFYYIMELADAETTPGEETGSSPGPGSAASESYTPRTLRSELSRRRRIPPADAAQLSLRLAGALGHLHSHGLVHRDIKPANVIFVSGQPKLADIGLVTDAGDSRSFVGTEGFIPPEGPGSAQADLYALGKVLYELATGRDRADFPQLPTDVMRLPEGPALLELNEIMTRACAPNPTERYGSATELQAELNLFLSGRSLRRVRHVERYLTRLKHTTVAGALVLVLAAVVVWLAKAEERRAREKAVEAEERARAEAQLRQRAEQAEQAGRQQLYTALLEQARATVRGGERGQRVQALEAVRRAALITNSLELRAAAMAALALPDLRLEKEIPTPTNRTATALDGAFTRLAVVAGRGPVQVFSLSDQQLLATLPPSTNLPSYSLLWSVDGRFLALTRDHDTEGREADVEVWRMEDAQRILARPNIPWGAIAFRPGEPQLLIGERTSLELCDLETGSTTIRFPMTNGAFRFLWAPNGRTVAMVPAAGSARELRVIDLFTGRINASRSFGGIVGKFDWHPSGKWIAVPEASGTVHLMDAVTGTTRPLGRHQAEAVSARFSPDGSYLVSGGWERELICWDMQILQRAFVAGLNSYTFQFSADGRRCAVEMPGDLRLFAFESPVQQRPLDNLGARLRQVSFSPDGEWVGASGSSRLALWRVGISGPAALLVEGGDRRIAFSANGEFFATRTNCVAWRLETIDHSPPQWIPTAPPVSGDVTSISTTADATIFTGANGSLLVSNGWDAGTDSIPRWVPTTNGFARASPDGRWLGVARSFSQRLEVYGLPTLEPVARIAAGANIARFSFSPGGEEVALMTRNRIELWSTTTWQRTRALPGLSTLVYAAEQDYAWLAQNFRAGALYHLPTLTPLLPLPGDLEALAISEDGRWLALKAHANFLQVLDLAKVKAHLQELGLDWTRSP